MAQKLNHEVAYRGDSFEAALSKHHIVVCGAGAIGSNLVETLVKQGVPNISVIDMDRVEQHNVSTQIYGEEDIGAVKVNALQNRIYRDNSVEVSTVNKELTQANVKKLLKGATLVIDSFDNKESREIVYAYCKDNDIPCLHSGMIDGYGEVVWNDIYNVPNDPDEDETDICDYPLARNLILFVVSITAEEVVNFCSAKKPRKKSWCFTLKDLKITNY